MVTKTRLRERLRQRRRRLSLEERLAAADAVGARLESLLADRSTVGVYAAFDGEVSIDQLVDRFPDKRFAWPKTPSGSGLMVFLAQDDVPEELGAFSIRTPLGKDVVPVEAFDAMLVPGVAFSPTGTRLGLGMGFYDRYLTGLRSDAQIIGVAYDWQILNELPEDPHDVPMTHIVTDARTLRCREREGDSGSEVNEDNT